MKIEKPPASYGQQKLNENLEFPSAFYTLKVTNDYGE